MIRSKPGTSLARLNLNLLYPLDAILTTRTLAEAGRRVFLSQPAMSHALRKLRDHFGDELISYVGGERVLTELAEALQPRVRNALQAADETFRLGVTFDPSQSDMTIRIAMQETIEVEYKAGLIRRLMARAPHITVELTPILRESVDLTLDNGADIVIAPEYMTNPKLPKTFATEDRLTCLIAKTNPIFVAHQADIERSHFLMDLDTYLAARHVVVDEELYLYQYLASDQRALLSRRNIVVRTSFFETLPYIVANSDLIATINSSSGQRFSSAHDVTIVSFDLATARVCFQAQWQSHRGNDPLVKWLVAEITRQS